MKIIQSFWSKPAINPSVPHQVKLRTETYMLQVLSCLKYKEFYPVHLVTDRKGKEIWIDILQLPYDSVAVELDQLNHYPAAMWAVGKLYAYQMQDEPFLHVDGDTFIWGRFPEEIEKSGLAVQNIEPAELHPGNTVFFRQMHDKLDFIPSYMEKEWTETGGFTEINAGIFGGYDLEFIRQYINESLSFVEKNYRKLPTFGHPEIQSSFNMVFEQYLFYCLARSNHKELKQLIHYDNEEDIFQDMMYLHTVPYPNKYIHLLATYKRIPIFIGQVGQILWKEYPEYYTRIVDNIKKGYL